MTNLLCALFSDFKLYGLFGRNQNLTVSQIWLLEIKHTNSTELRFLYGRSLPSAYQLDSWCSAISDKASLNENCSVNIYALTLYTTAEKLKIFLKQFIIEGATLQNASQHIELTITGKFAPIVGAGTFGMNPIVRPTMHLPTRDYYQCQTSRLSPTSYASVDSAAISPAEKAFLFSSSQGYEISLAKMACKALSTDTGMEFSTLDAWRIGDFEFFCAPGLKDMECAKYDISFKESSLSLKLLEPLTQEHSALLIVVKTYSDGCIQSSYISRLDKDVSYPFHHTFQLKEFQKEICTAYTLEIYAQGSDGEQSFLLLQTGNYFFREISLHQQVSESIRTNGPTEWLAKKVPDQQKPHLEAAGKIERTMHSFRSRIGGYKDDPWVLLNRLTEDCVKQLLPKKSDGRFFLTLDDSGGKSRLLLVDWLRNIFNQHHNAQVAWIDPHMEDVGIQLLNQLGTKTANYLIITTEKESNNDSKKNAGQPGRLANLLESCNGWGNGYFGNVRLKVFTVPSSKLHDRMILIRSPNGLPLAGYHLSNSVQRASENQPLLATPIPLDILPQVFEHVEQIIQRTFHCDGKSTPTAKIIFDSADFANIKRNALSQDHSFIDSPHAGDVLAWWLDDMQFSHLSGSHLKEKMSASNIDFSHEQFYSLPAKFWSKGLPFANFHSAWDALGDLLASCHAGCHTGPLYNKEKVVLSESVKLALLQHIYPSRSNALQPQPKKSNLDIEHYCSQDFTKLLLSHENPFSVFNDGSKNTSYSDYYAIKLIWAEAPEQLVSWLGALCSEATKDLRSRALIAEAFKYICLTVSSDKNGKQIDALLRSNVDIINWIGVYAIKRAINRTSLKDEIITNAEYIEKIKHFKSNAVQRTILCWLINEAIYYKSEAKSELVNTLMQLLQEPLTDGELQNFLQPVRNRLGRLHYVTPWILESMLMPMLEKKLISIRQVAMQWLKELTTQWLTALKKNDCPFFTLDADGGFTDELAVLTKYLDTNDQAHILKELKKVFDKLARTIRRPMSAQVNWKAYNAAYQINQWLYTLSRRIAVQLGDDSALLNELLLEAKSVIQRAHGCDRDIMSSDELFAYLNKEHDEINSHDLHLTIQRVTLGR